MRQILSTLVLIFYATSANASYEFKVYDNTEGLPFDFGRIAAFQMDESLKIYPEAEQQTMKEFVLSRVHEQFDLLKQRLVQVALVTNDAKELIGVSWLARPDGDLGEECREVRQTNITAEPGYVYMVNEIFDAFPGIEYLRMKIPHTRLDWLRLHWGHVVHEVQPYEEAPGPIKWVFLNTYRPVPSLEN
jgi:hypothetical protein